MYEILKIWKLSRKEISIREISKILKFLYKRTYSD